MSVEKLRFLTHRIEGDGGGAGSRRVWVSDVDHFESNKTHGIASKKPGPLPSLMHLSGVIAMSSSNTASFKISSESWKSTAFQDNWSPNRASKSPSIYKLFAK